MVLNGFFHWSSVNSRGKKQSGGGDIDDEDQKNIYDPDHHRRRQGFKEQLDRPDAADVSEESSELSELEHAMRTRICSQNGCSNGY